MNGFLKPPVGKVVDTFQDRFRRVYTPYVLGGSTVCAFLVGMQLFGQTNSASSSSKGGSNSATQLPLSGRGASNGAVSTTQSVPNSGTNSVNVINSTVNLSGPYAGSVADPRNTGASLSLTLDYALTLGMRNNLGGISQSNSVLQAEGQRVVARSALLPNLNSSLTETLEQLNLASQGIRIPGIPTVVGPFNFFDARAVRLNQTVFDFVQLGNLRSAGQSVKAAQASAMDARDLIVLAVAGSYLQVVAAQARVVAQGAQVESSRSVYQQASDRLKAGLAARIDETRSQVQYQTDVQRLRSDVAEVDRQKLSLSRVIGLPFGSDFTVADNYPYTPLNDMSVADALKRAYTTRGDLLSAKASLRAAELAMKAAHAEYLPSLSLSGDYGAIGLNPSQAHGTVTVAGTLTIPIFQGGKVQGDSQQARAALNQRKAELQDTYGVIDHDVRVAFIDLSAAADQVTVAESNVSLSHDTLLQARDRFVAGVADTVEVVQAEQTVAQADNDYISAVFEHNLAKVSLSRAIGQAELTVRQLLKGR